jgi:hypothetical protein
MADDEDGGRDVDEDEDDDDDYVDDGYQNVCDVHVPQNSFNPSIRLIKPNVHIYLNENDRCSV